MPVAVGDAPSPNAKVGTPLVGLVGVFMSTTRPRGYRVVFASGIRSGRRGSRGSGTANSGWLLPLTARKVLPGLSPGIEIGVLTLMLEVLEAVPVTCTSE